MSMRWRAAWALGRSGASTRISPHLISAGIISLYTRLFLLLFLVLLLLVILKFVIVVIISCSCQVVQPLCGATVSAAAAAAASASAVTTPKPSKTASCATRYRRSGMSSGKAKDYGVALCDACYARRCQTSMGGIWEVSHRRAELQEQLR